MCGRQDNAYPSKDVNPSRDVNVLIPRPVNTLYYIERRNFSDMI